MDMRKLLLALAAVAAFAGVAEARDGCGRGWYYNGYRCVPARAAPPVVVAPRYMAPPPRYAPRSFAYAGPDRWGKPQYYPGPRGTCPKGFTVQSGLCKPYRGY
ncbi:GCG_CRPN prefix-to-repeats domain-containing protein [Pseudorhodoplanes sinuspersici]|uniref:Uncharacterized protein n=1 Tax=Pseudorhodoplanes sinuspersici TaxID=1235591 RepID=A0A1W6ZMF4_9HYPH|nr:hypothetical protein [Pseudorhodoplanes sinuspersici]ARP97954.1 hypothetical protein CAK95_01820 [Pseudorhodoplanes sinuspersici]RKE68299.1 hypothetical protein DFP91_4674 [Pseudorhodoplanes sinuspersici]